MSNEAIFFSFVGTVILALVGVIWRQLGQKIRDNEITFNSSMGGAREQLASLSANIAALRVKLAEEYRTSSETRQLTMDLIAPVKQQLDRMEGMLTQALSNK